MLKIVFVILVIIHALFHLFVFSKKWNFADTTTFRKGIFIHIPSRLIVTSWLFTSIILFCSALLYLLEFNAWWMLGATGLLLSQILIMLHWKNTKYGTLINIILLATVILSYGSWSF